MNKEEIVPSDQKGAQPSDVKESEEEPPKKGYQLSIFIIITIIINIFLQFI